MNMKYMNFASVPLSLHILWCWRDANALTNSIHLPQARHVLYTYNALWNLSALFQLPLKLLLLRLLLSLTIDIWAYSLCLFLVSLLLLVVCIVVHSLFMLHMRLHQTNKISSKNREQIDMNASLSVHGTAVVASRANPVHTLTIQWHSNHWNAYLADCVMVDGLFRVTCSLRT